MARRGGSRAKKGAGVATREWWGAAALAALPFAWGLVGEPAPLSLHPDGVRFAELVGGRSGDAPFLAAALGRIATTLSGAAANAVGRGLAAIFGALSILLAWRLLRDALAPRWALFGAALMAVVPLFTVPVRTVPDDTLALFLGLAAVTCLARFSLRPERPTAVALGALVGAAIASRHGNAVLLLVAAISPAIAAPRRRRAVGESLGLAAVVGIATFVTMALVLEAWLSTPAGGPMALWTDLGQQVERFWRGDHLSVSAPAHFFAFHLSESLRPGLTLPVLVTTLGGSIVAFARRRRLAPGAKLLLLQGGLVYLLAELSPLKPHPDFVRYVLPLLPAAALASGLGLQAVDEAMRRPWMRTLGAIAVVATLAVPTSRSFELARAAGDDTRLQADRWLREHGGRALREAHSSAERTDVPSLANVDLDAARRGGITYVVASSFVYETFARGSRLADQKDYVYDRHESYQALFDFPYVEFAPRRPGLGWSNPTIRVVDIREPRPPGRP